MAEDSQLMRHDVVRVESGFRECCIEEMVFFQNMNKE